MKGRIKLGAGLMQDYHFGRWPYCLVPKSQGGGYEAKNPNMLFDVEWKGSYWDCRTDGFGKTKDGKGEYGCGSIFVSDKHGVILDYSSVQKA